MDADSEGALFKRHGKRVQRIVRRRDALSRGDRAECS